MTIFVGVDPGRFGAIAALYGDHVVTVDPIPTLEAAVKNKRKQGRREYDIPSIREHIFELGPLAELFVTVEQSRPLPPTMKGGSIANFHRGVSRAGWEWMLVALRVSYQLVSPQKWQREMHAGLPGSDTKQKSILAAQRLFPDADLRRTERCRKKDDGMAEALLLAEFGRRTRGTEE